ncbi:hypothetical protein MASR2M18_21290 [Ignavibacteria bacterium]
MHSTYNYSANNPLIIIDPSGLAAWEIKNQWNDDYIERYRKFVKYQAEMYKKSGKEFTCEDLALQIVIDFSSQNNLPLKIRNGKGVFNAASDNFNSALDFSNAVLLTTGARDLQNADNSISINISSSNIGDFLLLRNENGVAHHTQLITSITEFGVGREINIHQGNSGWLNAPYIGGALGGANPTSLFYTGQKVEQGIIDTQGNYSNLTNVIFTPNYLYKENVESRKWNFLGWNKK